MRCMRRAYSSGCTRALHAATISIGLHACPACVEYIHQVARVRCMQRCIFIGLHASMDCRFSTCMHCMSPCVSIQLNLHRLIAHAGISCPKAYTLVSSAQRLSQQWHVEPVKGRRSASREGQQHGQKINKNCPVRRAEGRPADTKPSDTEEEPTIMVEPAGKKTVNYPYHPKQQKETHKNNQKHSHTCSKYSTHSPTVQSTTRFPNEISRRRASSSP